MKVFIRIITFGFIFCVCFSLNGCKRSHEKPQNQEKPQSQETLKPLVKLQNPEQPKQNGTRLIDTYPNCAEWYDDDGCNTCSRREDGYAYCTLVSCGLVLVPMECKPSEGAEEEYKKYKERVGKCVEGNQENFQNNDVQSIGDRYPNCAEWYNDDGCNTCSRREDGHAYCTLVSCGLALVPMDCEPSEGAEEEYKKYKEKAGKCVE